MPYLVRELRKQDSVWARIYFKAFAMLPGTIQRISPRPPAARMEVRTAVARALSALGRDAQPAVPALIESLRSADPFSQSGILQTLRGLSFSRADLDPVLEDLAAHGKLAEALQIVTSLSAQSPAAARLLSKGLQSGDPRTRRACACQLQLLPEQASLIVPALAAALQDSDPEVQTSAAYALEQLGLRSAAALPALILALQSPEDQLRYSAARALEQIGPAALPAMPVLQQATNDPSEMVRRVAARTVEKLRNPAVTPN